jgi:hypothetical protein
MDLEKAQAKPPMSMVVFMMENGSMTKSMVTGSINIKMILNIMESGKKIFEKAMEPTITQMEIDTKVTGISISKVGLELTTIPMEIFTKDNGSMESPTAKGIIYITETKESTKETGKMVKKKDLVSLLLMINMATPESGNRIKKMGEDHTFIQMVSDMKEDG